MTRRETLFYVVMLVVFGAGWGFTQPMTKLAVSEGYQHFGLIFWQMAIGAAVMTPIALIRGIRLPLGAPQIRIYVIIAFIGSLLPNTASYQAAVHLPSGILSILLSMIPIWAFPIALLLALDSFEWRRFAGLLAGLSAVLLLVVPSTDLTLALPVLWVLVGLISGLFYAFEGNFVAKWGTAGLGSIQVLWGASLVGAVVSLPVALASGQWIDPRPPYGIPDYAQIAASVMHVLVYTGYVWLVGRAGPVFAVQISYLVTLFGVCWAYLLLGESYPPLVWASLALMLLGMALVQPRRKQLLAAEPAIGDVGR